MVITRNADHIRRELLRQKANAQWERMKADPEAYAERNRRVSEGHKGLMVGEKNPMYGKKISDEHRKKLSEAHSKSWNTEEKKAYASGRSKKFWEKIKSDPEKYQAYLKKLSDANKGQVVTQAQREAISKANTGRHHVVTDETRKKLSEVLTGLKRTPEAIANMSKAAIKRMANPEIRKKVSDSLVSRFRGEKSPRFWKPPAFSKRIHDDSISHVVRSTLEQSLFKILVKNKIDYTYEAKMPITTSDQTHRNYWVDARVNGTNFFIEGKGWADSFSVDKMSSFRAQYPQCKLIVVTYKKSLPKFPPSSYDYIFCIDNEQDMNDIISLIEMKTLDPLHEYQEAI